jgi:hypothetical protein
MGGPGKAEKVIYIRRLRKNPKENLTQVDAGAAGTAPSGEEKKTRL